MKKLIILTSVISVFCTTTAFSAPKSIATENDSKLSLKAGFNMGGNMTINTKYDGESIKSEKDVEGTAFFVGAEYSLNKQQNSDLGIGANYMFEREEFSIIPVYGYGKLKLGHDFSLVGTVGYNFVSLNDKPDELKMKNGICYSVGVESQINPSVKLFADYEAYNAAMEMEIYGYKIKSDLSYTTLAFGLSFNIQN